MPAWVADFSDTLLLTETLASATLAIAALDGARFASQLGGQLGSGAALSLHRQPVLA
jgi:hypothetical protein